MAANNADALQLADSLTNGLALTEARKEDNVCSQSDLQCAICLEDIKLCDVATVRGCEHVYCVTCILQWATTRETAACPTCKEPITSLLVHRDVDGTLSDAPICEPVAFLARAPWYVAWAAERSQVNELTRQHAIFRSREVAESERSPLSLAQEEWAEEAMYGFFEGEIADDEDLEDEYFASMSRPRHTFGNRPWGPDGYVASGHRRARPVYRGQPAGKPGGRKGGDAASGGGAKVGRRAQRKAARAARDAGEGGS